MIFYLDTEFHEHKKKIMPHRSKGDSFEIVEVDTIELISIGIHAEDNRTYYSICKEFDVEAAWNNKWLRENVLINIFQDLIFNKASDLPNIFDFTLSNLKYFLDLFGKSKKQIAKEIIAFVSNGECLCETNTKDAVHYDSELMKYKCDMHSLPVADKPKFYSYYADYDWVVICWLFGRMIDLPTGFPMFCFDLKQDFENMLDNLEKIEIQKAVDVEPIFGTPYISKSRTEIENELKSKPDYPTQDNEHNAYDDALFHFKLHNFIKKYNNDKTRF